MNDIQKTLHTIAGNRKRPSQLEYVARKTELASKLILKDDVDLQMTSKELDKCAMIVRKVAIAIREIMEDRDG